MPDNKKWYESRTYWGLFLALLGIVAHIIQPMGGVFPQPFLDFMNNDFVDIMARIGEFGGIILAAYGRNKATKGISL